MKILHAKCFAVIMGVGAFMLGALFSGSDDRTLSFVNYGGCIFALFLYLNPGLLIAKSVKELDEILDQAVGLHFMWLSIGIGLMGAFIDFF